MAGVLSLLALLLVFPSSCLGFRSPLSVFKRWVCVFSDGRDVVWMVPVHAVENVITFMNQSVVEICEVDLLG